MVPTRYNNRKSGHYHSINHCKDTHALHLIVTIGVAPRVLAPHQCANYARPFMIAGGHVPPGTWKGRVFYGFAPSKFLLLCASVFNVSYAAVKGCALPMGCRVLPAGVWGVPKHFFSSYSRLPPAAASENKKRFSRGCAP